MLSRRQWSVAAREGAWTRSTVRDDLDIWAVSFVRMPLMSYQTLGIAVVESTLLSGIGVAIVVR